MSDDVIKLPEIDYDDPYPLIRSMNIRRSVRDFNGEPLTRAELSKLLWSCQGITDTKGGFKTAPSAGGIHPFTIYVMIEDGVYLYDPAKHSLFMHKAGDWRKDLTRASLDQKALLYSGAILILAYSPEMLEARYSNRAFRYACMEAGHIAQNALLTAESLGLKAVAVGAYYDDFVKDILDIQGEPLYMVAVGRV